MKECINSDNFAKSHVIKKAKFQSTLMIHRKHEFIMVLVNLITKFPNVIQLNILNSILR